MSFFERDLHREQVLGRHLDKIYKEKGLVVVRNDERDLQHKGVDLVYTRKERIFYIDEKAQLNYINVDLPTFTFELSFLKDGLQRPGWLFDSTKLTTHYFLVTGIFSEDKEALETIDRCKILSVDRKKLLAELEEKKLSATRLNEYDRQIRNGNGSGKIAIDELNPKTQGNLYFSEQLAEKPLNLQLRLKYLKETGVGKIIH